MKGALMITILNETTDKILTLTGLVADLTDAPACSNGSTFFAMDEGKTYYYDAAGDQWVDPTAEP